ncbi:MAG: hypothetical protein WC822_02600 [Candidatus Paceibacterota bacterium]|jgi:hypothetical protein
MNNIKIKFFALSIISLFSILMGVNMASAKAVVSTNSVAFVIPTVYISANDTNVNYGANVNISWSSKDANYCIGTNFNTKNTTSGKVRTGALFASTTYNIICYNNSGSSSRSITVKVRPQIQNISVIQSPLISLSADNSVLYLNKLDLYGTNYPTTKIRWSSAFAVSCVGNSNSDFMIDWIGPKNLSGVFSTGSLQKTTTYTISCKNSEGTTTTKSVTITVIK